ncbi:hypothetical protein Tsubulata_017899 [Turnera subulata]|uniref:Protein kinase domain-containing protein n=1 Tax=Turnera subulata TaxID=218843 RepID=A0A9Q0F4K6_9ROSI|nr:hypothetical protein Tsubulata_017899 [Turnera subulata]
MACKIFSLLLLISLPPIIIANAQGVEFVYHGFNGSEREIDLDRASFLKPSGVLRLTNRTPNAIGHAFYSKPIQMFNTSTSSSSSSSSSTNAPSSFSTSFVFQINPSPSGGKGGYGFAFVLAPSKNFPGAAPGHFLGLFNETNHGSPSNYIFAVEFDTVSGFNESSDSEGNHVGINLNSMDSIQSATASYEYTPGKERDFRLEGGKPIQAWIEYDGVNKVLNVTVCPVDKIQGQIKPLPLISRYPFDLTPHVKETMYVGFSASTGETNISSHYVMGWSFALNGVAPPLNASQLPTPPADKKGSSSYKPSVVALIASLCSVTVILLGILFFIFVYKRMGPSVEVLEDWELDSPHRFQYRDLHKGTKGFNESEIIGVGGFGAVYKAVLPNTGSEVAVKKIKQDAISGLREFKAEIESLGRLRHKNLVNLQGWLASGRRPVDSDTFHLADWVMECKENGSMEDVADPKLESNYVSEEMELVLGLGLLCCRPKPETRPTMRQVTRYLDGDEPLPAVEDWSTRIGSEIFRSSGSKFSEVVSAELISISRLASSVRSGVSTSSSFGGGR